MRLASYIYLFLVLPQAKPFPLLVSFVNKLLSPNWISDNQRKIGQDLLQNHLVAKSDIENFTIFRRLLTILIGLVGLQFKTIPDSLNLIIPHKTQLKWSILGPSKKQYHFHKSGMRWSISRHLIIPDYVCWLPQEEC